MTRMRAKLCVCLTTDMYLHLQHIQLSETRNKFMLVRGDSVPLIHTSTGSAIRNASKAPCFILYVRDFEIQKLHPSDLVCFSCTEFV
jgi:hypothetical protein